MLSKQIVYFGNAVVLSCDGNCAKAWGVNNRPRESFDPKEPDDYAFLADNELDVAPVNPGTYEGGHPKPRIESERLNSKWCARECERSKITDPGAQIKLDDYSQRVYNQPWKHVAATTRTTVE